MPAPEVKHHRATVDATDTEIVIWECSRPAHRWWLEKAHSYLDSHEVARAGRLVRGDDVERFVLGRGALRTIVAAHTGASPKTVRLAADHRGKPYLVDHPDIRFNVAHSGDVVLVAVRRSLEVGVDVERIRPEVLDRGLARRFMSTDEVEGLERLDPISAVERFFEIWVHKEAYVKALGLGLSSGLGAFTVSPGSDRPSPVADRRSSETWSTLGLAVASGHRAAVATRGQDWRVRMEVLETLL